MPTPMPEGSWWEHPWRGLLSFERTSVEYDDYFSLEGDSALAVIDKKFDIHPFGRVDLVASNGEVSVAGPDTGSWTWVTPPGVVVRGLRFAPSRAADLTSLAVSAGYADQAHLSRDCRELTGTTASEFFVG